MPSPRAVERAVLDGLGEVLGRDGVGAGQIGDGAGDAEEVAVDAGGGAEAGEGQAE